MTDTTICRSTQHLGEVTNLATYLERVNDVLKGATQGLFRGHRDAGWMLMPAVARQTFNVRPEDESAMLEEFKRRAIPYLESSYDLSETDWLAIAQHHGLPTRLLDWSGSALAALWFAVNKPAAASASGAVWILEYGSNDLMTDQERQAPFDIKRTALVRPRHVSRRITAQDGWFTLHRAHLDDGQSVPFVALETKQDFMQRLHYVTIPPEAFGVMRLQLDKAGVTSAVLFPDLEGIAAYVARTHLYLPDEILSRLGGIDSNL